MSKQMAKKERLTWLIALGVLLVIAVSTAGVWIAGAVVATSRIAANDAQLAAWEAEIDAAGQVQAALDDCDAAWESLVVAADGYLAAGGMWADEISSILDYGIFGGDVVALYAIPQVVDEADYELSNADAIGCSAQ